MRTLAQLISTFGKDSSSGELCRELNARLSELGISAHTHYLPSEDKQKRHFMIHFQNPRQASLVCATLREFKGVLFGLSTVIFMVTDQ